MTTQNNLQTWATHLVIADLQSKGFEVWEAKGKCSCDLIARRDDKERRLKVRTGQYFPNGTINFNKDARGADEFAVVIKNTHTIHYLKINDDTK